MIRVTVTVRDRDRVGQGWVWVRGMREVRVSKGSFVMLGVVMLSVILLSVVMLCVVTLSVVAPFEQITSWTQIDLFYFIYLHFGNL